ncbi:hypothetical protein D3C86_2205460 [compost metagenome]
MRTSWSIPPIGKCTNRRKTITMPRVQKIFSFSPGACQRLEMISPARLFSCMAYEPFLRANGGP